MKEQRCVFADQNDFDPSAGGHWHRGFLSCNRSWYHKNRYELNAALIYLP